MLALASTQEAAPHARAAVRAGSVCTRQRRPGESADGSRRRAARALRGGLAAAPSRRRVACVPAAATRNLAVASIRCCDAFPGGRRPCAAGLRRRMAAAPANAAAVSSPNGSSLAPARDGRSASAAASLDDRRPRLSRAARRALLDCTRAPTPSRCRVRRRSASRVTDRRVHALRAASRAPAPAAELARAAPVLSAAAPHEHARHLVDAEMARLAATLEPGLRRRRRPRVARRRRMAQQRMPRCLHARSREACPWRVDGDGREAAGRRALSRSRRSSWRDRAARHRAPPPALFRSRSDERRTTSWGSWTRRSR